MEKNMSNKLFRGLLALSAGLLLASCDPVHALPKNHAENIVMNEDASSIDVKDNDLLQIYNLIESGKNEEVVSLILSEIAEKRFGTYKEFYEAANGSDEVRDAYIAAHKEYFGEDENKVTRFNDFVEDIASRISESFYNEITSGSYNDQDGKFSEEKLYNAKRYDLYDLPAASAEVQANKFYVTKDLTKDNALDYLVGEYFNFEEGKRGYIEEKVFPEILKNKLVESYIYDNNPSSLGRAYARKINYIKVSYDEEFASLWKLLKKFSAEYIEKEQASSLKDNFELITSAVKGFTEFDENKMVNSVYADASEDATSAKVKALLEEAHAGETDDVKYITVPVSDDYKYGTSITLVPAGTYYRDTKLGKILESYEDAIQAEKDGRFATTSQKAELDKFTGEGKSKEYGLMQKLISLAKEDYTTDGWFLKNGGATELPSAIRDRLFNIKVANILDDNVSSESHKAALPVEETIGEYDEKNYLRNISGNKLMLSSEASTFENEHYNYIHQDVDGKAFYIVEVLEAPSTAKFNEKSETVYKKADGAVDKVRIEQLSRQVAKILGTKDSYIKDAYTDILEDYEFKFYDSSLFDYLNSEYPDLDLDENDD